MSGGFRGAWGSARVLTKKVCVQVTMGGDFQGI